MTIQNFSILEYQEKLVILDAKNHEFRDWKPKIENLLNIDVCKNKCFQILKCYEELIEWIMAELSSGQEKCLKPIEDFLNNQLTEIKHENSMDKNNVSNAKPFVISTCKLPDDKSESDEEINEKMISSRTTSISSFEYNGHHYASTKVKWFLYFIKNIFIY